MGYRLSPLQGFASFALKIAASVSEGRFAFSGFIFYGLVFNPVGAAGFVAAGVGAGVGWFGLAWLSELNVQGASD